MSPLDAFLDAGHPIDHAPFRAAGIDRPTWEEAIASLVSGGTTLLSVWAEIGGVRMALLDAAGDIAILALDCPEARYPAIGRLHPPAIRLERTIRDLFGIEPEGLPDARPWLDHGRWGGGAGQPAASYPFLPVTGSGLHQVPVGPVHAGIIEPGHFRFTCDGETVVRLEQRLGYVHKGIDRLLAGAPLAHAVKLAARVSGDSTVAYSWGFARAVESALGVTPPLRAVWLRAIMAEMERLANHLGDFGAICNDASFGMMLAHSAVLREHVLRAAATCFGHRLMMDRIVPGGVTTDLEPTGVAALTAFTAELRKAFPALVELYDGTASLLDRTVSTGRVSPALVRQFGAGGYVGRAAGRNFDARRSPGYAPYDALSFEVPLREEGDVDARVWIRIREIEESLSLLEQLIRGLPAGPIRISVDDIPAETREGTSLTEAFRGDVLVWVRLQGGVVERCHLRDASWFQWPLLEAAIEGNIVADFPLCNKSFNCSYSGHDL
jgi:Ni,Fe-hydrogenase III large subunit